MHPNTNFQALPECGTIKKSPFEGKEICEINNRSKQTAVKPVLDFTAVFVIPAKRLFTFHRLNGRVRRVDIQILTVNRNTLICTDFDIVYFAAF